MGKTFPDGREGGMQFGLTEPRKISIIKQKSETDNSWLSLG